MAEPTREQLAEDIQRLQRFLGLIASDARVALGLVGLESTTRAVARALLDECTPGQLASLAAVAVVRLIEAGWKPEATGG